MSPGSRLTRWSARHYKTVTAIVSTVTILTALVSVLPSLLPDSLPFMHAVRVDTDPENMLSADEPVRIFHDEMKKTLSLHDIVVVGVVNEQHPDGVFNPESLRKVHELTEFAKKLTGYSDEGRKAGLKPGEGVIAADIIAPSTVDNIIPIAGGVKFEWLMPEPPKTAQAAREVLANAQRIPFFRGTMVPPKDGDAQAVCIYLPITSKNISYKIYRAVNGEIAKLGGPEKFHVTGLPVAEDTFGVEMFIQMGISAPAAMFIIFVLMLAFFRKLLLVISPMIVALVSVIITMGSLIIAGFPVHIMSSMIPIFIMPIAVLDSIHIISEFFEKYQATRDRRRTIMAVMDDLFMPMLYTSLTSAAGFASLALTPIPPVQVFGIFVAAGIMVAWLLTVTFIPAYVMFISPKTLENFGAKYHRPKGKTARGTRGGSLMSKFLDWMGGATWRRAKPILAFSLVLLVVAGWGISRININDNPIKWFTPTHPIREADRVLNNHFGGTYMAYLAMEYTEPPFDAAQYAADLAKRADKRSGDIAALVEKIAPNAKASAAESDSFETFFSKLKDRLRPNPDTAGDGDLSAWTAVEGFLDRELDRLEFAEPHADFDKNKTPLALGEMAKAFSETFKALVVRMKSKAESIASKPPASRAVFLDGLEDLDGLLLVSGPDATMTREGRLTIDAAKAAARFLIGEERQLHEVFKRPEVLAHMKGLSGAMAGTGIVGKSNSLVEIVETVNRDLHAGRSEYERIPGNRKAVGSCITQFTSSHRPQDLSHFVTTDDYQTASMWVQLKSGDNKDMSA
ncbi:MAG: MMPL family transporter, partial [Planctomycetota bacterium]|nr:MMPL family transporter [Planctomycetota bacterium]